VNQERVEISAEKIVRAGISLGPIRQPPTPLPRGALIPLDRTCRSTIDDVQ